MARQRQQPQPAPAAAAEAPARESELESVLRATEERGVTYTPFMAKESIRLNVPMVKAYLCTPTKSGKLCDDRQAARFIMLCKARGLNPFEGDAFLIGYDTSDGPQFSLITAHQAFLKRAEVHPKFDGMESGVVVETPDSEIRELQGDFFPKGHKLLGGWAKVYLKERRVPTYRRLKLETFQKPYGRWKDDAAGMIVKCAEADALRSSFPNSLGGMYLDGELSIDDLYPAAPSGRPAPRSAQELKERLREQAQQAPKNGAPSPDPAAGEPAAGSPADPAATPQPAASPTDPAPPELLETLKGLMDDPELKAKAQERMNAWAIASLEELNTAAATELIEWLRRS